MNYSQIKKLDEDTAREIQEGVGPVSECLCSLLAPPDEPARGIRGSIKRALASMGGKRGGRGGGGGRGSGGGTFVAGGNVVEIPLTYDKGGRGIYTTKEEVKRRAPCGKCGCDKEKMFMKTSFANIRITSPDVSSICPCPNSACMPGKDKLNNNISVTVERMEMSDIDTDDETTKDRKTDEKTTQVQVQKKPSSDTMTSKRPSELKDRYRNRPKTPSTKDKKTVKRPSNKDLANERQKKRSFKELHQSWKSLKVDHDFNIDVIDQQLRENEGTKEQENMQEEPVDHKKTTRRRKDHDDVEHSVSFSGRLEEKHEDVLKRPYHN